MDVQQQYFKPSEDPRIRFINIQKYEEGKLNSNVEKILSIINKPTDYDKELTSHNASLNSKWEVIFVPNRETDIYACLILEKDLHNKEDVKKYVENFLELKFNFSFEEYSYGENYDFCKNYIDFRLPRLFEKKELLVVYDMSL